MIKLYSSCSHTRDHALIHSLIDPTTKCPFCRGQVKSGCQLSWQAERETRKKISLCLILRWQVLQVMTRLLPVFTPAFCPVIPCMDAPIDCCQKEGPEGEHYPARSEGLRWPREASWRAFSCADSGSDLIWHLAVKSWAVRMKKEVKHIPLK